MNDTNMVVLPCAAGDHALMIQIEEEYGQVYLSVLIPEFYAKQRSFLGRWGERLKMAFIILRGREYTLEEVILDREAIRTLSSFLITTNAYPSTIERCNEALTLLTQWKEALYRCDACISAAKEHFHLRNFDVAQPTINFLQRVTDELKEASMARTICTWCANEYDDEEDGDVCMCGAEVCSDTCMMNHQDKECSEDY